MSTGYLLMRSQLHRNPADGAGRSPLGGLRGAQLLFVGGAVSLPARLCATRPTKMPLSRLKRGLTLMPEGVAVLARAALDERLCGVPATPGFALYCAAFGRSHTALVFHTESIRIQATPGLQRGLLVFAAPAGAQ